jgi:hypothetical protein
MPPIGDQAGKSVNAPKRRVRVRRPSAKRVSQARAQEQQYASQGNAVKRVASTQRKAAVRKTQLAKSKPVAGDAPQTRARDTQRAQAYVKKQYDTQAASDKARGIVRAPQVRVPYVRGTTVPPDVAAAVKVDARNDSAQSFRGREARARPEGSWIRRRVLFMLSLAPPTPP